MPTLSAAAQFAVFCWNWIGGWKPERLSLFVAFFPWDDVDGLLARLIVIRDAMNGKIDDEEPDA